jgi:adenylate kinase family enzyme
MPERIVVIGMSGSGKTTLARQLGQKLGLPHIEIDAIHWQAGWQMLPEDQLIEQLDSATSGPRWVVDGNYSVVRQLVWDRADTLVWLDYSFPLTLWRITRRTIGRASSQQELWNTNREHWRQVFSRDSMIWWVVRMYHKRQRQWRGLVPQFPHLSVHRFRYPDQTEGWLHALGSS